MACLTLLTVINWIVIYLVDCDIYPLDNWAQIICVGIKSVAFIFMKVKTKCHQYVYRGGGGGT